ncbi:MAG: DRTGG domain-containing protein [Bacteroidales bacterium]|nr:DRTGG domain-containing protein [Bacteroidales bacterium]MDD4574944.1 DRTGG domain-containing protein [Bacteroidales bacterium]
MKVIELAAKLGLKVMGGQDGLNKEVKAGYTSDLLSDVMGNVEAGSIWVTLQTHKNVMAVASLKDLSAIVIVNNYAPDQDLINQSEEEGIPVLVTSDKAFEISAKIYNLIK